MDALEIINMVVSWVEKLGVIGVLIAIVYGSNKRIWVWGYQLEKSEREAEAWRDLALRNSNIADQSLRVMPKREV